MRHISFAVSAAALALLATSQAEARPNFGASGQRAGGDASAARKAAEDAPTLIEAVAALMGLSVTAKATPVAGADAPRTTASKAKECEEETRRAAAEKAAGGQRAAADASKARTRGSEPLYLAF